MIALCPALFRTRTLWARADTAAILRRAVLTMFCLGLWLMPVAAFAQSPTPRTVTDDEVNAIAKQLYCPVCENIPLDVCPTQACADWREEIRLKLAEGWSEAQIKQYFVDRFGDRVLGAPPPRGVNWLVYLLPPLAVIAGLFLLYRALTSWLRPAGAHPSLPADLPQDEYVRRLEEELRNRDR